MFKTWTERDAFEILGQTESIRREFKSGLLFENQTEKQWVSNLSVEVSSFANTEGGEIFLGIEESKKSKPRIAVNIDGVPKAITPERLQQLVEGNVSPYLPGIRFQRLLLSSHPDRFLYVIQVPRGNTAYQANDGRYYGRSEFEAKYLPDHEVRLRMSRGKVGLARIDVKISDVEHGNAYENEEKRRRNELLQEMEAELFKNLDITPELLDLAATKFRPHKVHFYLNLQNVGELTLRNPVVKINIPPSPEISNGSIVLFDNIDKKIRTEDEMLYPGDETSVPFTKSHAEIKKDACFSEGSLMMEWEVYLDNSPPSRGKIDLGIKFQ